MWKQASTATWTIGGSAAEFLFLKLFLSLRTKAKYYAKYTAFKLHYARFTSIGYTWVNFTVTFTSRGFQVTKAKPITHNEGRHQLRTGPSVDAATGAPALPTILFLLSLCQFPKASSRFTTVYIPCNCKVRAVPPPAQVLKFPQLMCLKPPPIWPSSFWQSWPWKIQKARNILSTKQVVLFLHRLATVHTTARLFIINLQNPPVGACRYLGFPALRSSLYKTTLISVTYPVLSSHSGHSGD